jgi:hypothetical protein
LTRREQERRCLNCGSPLGLEQGFSSYCSASCVWEHDRLSKEAARTMESLREQVELEHHESKRRRFGVLGRLRGGVELDEDAAAVVALSEAGATVRQISRYTALEPEAVQKLLVTEDEARAARREARERARRRREGKSRAEARRAGAPEPEWHPPADWSDAMGDSLESAALVVQPDTGDDAAA